MNALRGRSIKSYAESGVGRDLLRRKGSGVRDGEDLFGFEPGLDADSVLDRSRARTLVCYCRKMASPIDEATLQMALIGYQAELSRIEQRMAEIRSQLGGRVDPAVATKAMRKRTMSAAARARIAAAQKKRWAAFHKGKKAAAASEAPKAKRRISEEGLQRIIAATKKQWAAKRAAAANPAKPEPVAAKKAAGKKAAVKTVPARAAKQVAAKVAVQKPAPRKSAPAKAAKAPVKKAAKKSASVAAQPTGPAKSAATAEDVAQ